MASVAHHLPITFVEHYTDSYFRLRVERPEEFRFDSGQFIMIGLNIDGKDVMRAYSIANPFWDEELEFYSIIVQDGELTSRLKDVKVGDTLQMSAKAVGTLTLGSLAPGGKRLFMLSTGTGVAPFASIIRDEVTYETYDEVYLTQTCRFKKDLRKSRLISPTKCAAVRRMAQHDDHQPRAPGVVALRISRWLIDLDPDGATNNTYAEEFPRQALWPRAAASSAATDDVGQPAK